MDQKREIFDDLWNDTCDASTEEAEINWSIKKEYLEGWLSRLDEREQKILKLRDGIDGEKPLTFAEIGRQINISGERVRQLEEKAIDKLREMDLNRIAISDLGVIDTRLDQSDIAFYLTNIGKLPLLTDGEENALSSLIRLMKLLEDSDIIDPYTQIFALKKGKWAIDKLQRHNVRLVVSIAKEYQHQGLELLDLIQAGLIGLRKSIEDFDPDVHPSRRWNFSAYATECIRDQIKSDIEEYTM